MNHLALGGWSVKWNQWAVCGRIEYLTKEQSLLFWLFQNSFSEFLQFFHARVAGWESWVLPGVPLCTWGKLQKCIVGVGVLVKMTPPARRKRFVCHECRSPEVNLQGYLREFQCVSLQWESWFVPLHPFKSIRYLLYRGIRSANVKGPLICNQNYSFPVPITYVFLFFCWIGVVLQMPD